MCAAPHLPVLFEHKLLIDLPVLWHDIVLIFNALYRVTPQLLRVV